MRTLDEVQSKKEEYEEDLDGLEGEFEERVEDESLEEGSDDYQSLELEYEWKKKMLEKQVELLEWILNE